jgi:transposase
MEAKKWVGVDIHKKQMTVCFINETGQRQVKRYERNSAGIAEFLREIDKETVIGIESTTWTWGLAKRAEKIAKDVLILNTVELKDLMDKTKKTDRIDAIKIAIIIRRFEKEELSVCALKSEQWALVKGLLNIREKLVRQKVEMKNLIIATLDYWGIELQRKLFVGYKRDKVFLENIELANDLKEEIIKQFEIIRLFESRIKELDIKIHGLCSIDNGYQAITENINGIGKTCGAYLASKIENIERFDDQKKLVAYLGLAPKVNSSDDKNKGGHISGNTDKSLLRVLVQAAWASVRYDPEMYEYYALLKMRMCGQKAIIAVARKLVVKVFYVMKTNLA